MAFGSQPAAFTEWLKLVVRRGTAFAYVTPSWNPSRREHDKIIPSWNFVVIHAYGRSEFFDDEAGLLYAVIRLTDLCKHLREP
ncbi:FMN-binding negative transcriptional regulator [Aquamicrobium terrae]|uniref:FMN-binding regulatory protein PaiB n=1 Tax=Aquamicrobium terrae TaxID=1324945 RepID=A0ABV2N4K4_9HYPH